MYPGINGMKRKKKKSTRKYDNYNPLWGMYNRVCQSLNLYCAVQLFAKRY